MNLLLAICAGCHTASASLIAWAIFDKRERRWRTPTAIILLTLATSLAAYVGASR